MSAQGPFETLGRASLRREDRPLLLGQGRFLDDIVVPGTLHACFVRSPHAHARILRIDADVARILPGVEAVATGADLAPVTVPIRMAPPIEGLKPTRIDVLPVDKARFQGDPVACVVASDRYLAEDACEAVQVEYETLPAVADFDAALVPGAALIDDAIGTNLVSHQYESHGDVARRFASAHRVVEARFRQGRLTHAPIETRGCLAIWDEGRQHLTMHVGTQAPHPYRTQLATRLGLSESQVTVVSPQIGGAFGQKIAVYREEWAVAALARQLKRPVRWREDRMENLMAASHAREDDVRTRAAVDRDGRVLALELEIREDFGAYCFFPANYIARVVAMILTGPYRIRDYAFDVKVALTNKCGTGPMRAPMAITSWVMEGTLDAIADALALDPVAVRKLNMLRYDELPFAMPTGQILEDVSPRATLDLALERLDYAGFRARQEADRAQGIHRGLGICSVVESTTYGSAFYKSAGIPGSGHEAAWVKIEPSGAINASVGLMASGQGYETSLSQAVAEGLGVDAEKVVLKLGDTDVAPYGMGSRGGRGGTAGGGVLYLAARDLRAKLLAIAAALLDLNAPDELRLRAGKVERRLGGEWTATTLGLVDIARVAYLDPLRLPPGMEPGLEIHRAYDPPPMTYSNAAHLCVARVDVETGQVAIERYIVAEDCGTVLSPVVVEGQQHGAIAMGIGGALLEEVRYDAAGQNLSASFADYLLPTANELPAFEIIPHHTPNARTPTGSKGMAEGGVMGAVGAVALAVADALHPFGAKIERQPITPMSIRALLRNRMETK